MPSAEGVAGEAAEVGHDGEPWGPELDVSSGPYCLLTPMTKKIKIGISACLLGEMVRYDGVHKINRVLVRKLEKRFDLVAICPEVECGLLVPREPMELYGSVRSSRLRVAGSTIDLTGVMEDFAAKRINMILKERVCGVIMKNRSPSCAVDDAVILTAQGKKAGPGMFSRILAKGIPRLPIVDEETLADPSGLERFLESVAVYHRSLERRHT